MRVSFSDKLRFLFTNPRYKLGRSIRASIVSTLGISGRRVCHWS